MTASRGYLPQLDGIRAVAVLTIVAFHARTDLIPGGYVGVDLFFVLSGFLISGILLREVDQTGGIAFGGFYAKRALRLFPALVLMCAVVGVGFWMLDVSDRGESLHGILTSLTYTSSVLAASGDDLGWMVHTWSLSVEEAFYLAWPLALLLVARSRHRVEWLLAITSAAVGYRLAAGLSTDWTISRISYAPDTRAEQLLIGATLAAILMARRVRVPLPVVVTCALAFPVFALLPASVGGELYRDGGSTVIALAAAVLVAGLMQPGVLARIASLPPLVWIGQRSYGIYLWNLPIVALVAATPVPSSAQIPVKLALTIIIPALSYRFVEQPCLRLKGRYEKAETPRPAEAGRGAVPGVRARQESSQIFPLATSTSGEATART